MRLVPTTVVRLERTLGHGWKLPVCVVCLRCLSVVSVRVGLATGHALLFEGDDYIGSAVNMASRLCDAAGPLEVLMPTMQIERLPQGVIVTPHGEVELRGFPGPVDVVELSGNPDVPLRNDTGELWTRLPFGG